MKTKIKYIVIIAFAIVILGTINVRAAESIKLYFDNIDKVKTGENITLKIKGNNIEEQESAVAGMKIDVFYNTEIFEFVSAKKLDVARDTFNLHENYPDEGRIRIGFVSMTGLDKNGEIYEVILKAKENISKSESEIRLEVKEVVNSEDNDIPTVTENSIIKFKNVKEKDNSDKEPVNKQETNKSQEIQNETVKDETVVENKKEENNNIKISKQENKNIKELIQENVKDINTENNLTYRVDNPDILEIEADGNIIIKEKGIANIDIVSEDGTVKTIPIEVIDENTEIQNTENNYNIIYFIIIPIVIIAILLVIFKKAFKKKK